MILREVFCLEDHPFEPARDPATNFDFRGQKVTLMRGLELFRFDQLQRFYSQVGAFGVAVSSARSQMATSGYPTAGADSPVVLVSSSQGQGFSSLASYVASLVRAAAPDPAPSLVRVPVVSDHFGKALFLIARQLLAHLQAAGSPVADQLKEGLASVKPEDPDETYLLPNLEVLSGNDNTVPPLLLVIEKLTYSRFDWLARLHRVLKGYNVMLICHTDDPKVPPLFHRDVNAARFPGFMLALEGLTRQQALAFLQERLGLFRVTATPAEKAGIYPFFEEEVNKAFIGQERLTISLLIRLLRLTFNQKVTEQEQQTQTGVTPAAASSATVEDAYRSAIRNAAAAAAPGAGEGAQDDARP